MENSILAIYYGEQHPEDEVLLACLDGSATESDADKLIQRINQSGVIERTLDDARKCAENAVHNLSDFPTGREKDSLEKLGMYIIDRDL